MMEAEFSRIIKAAHVPQQGLHITETATPAECQALAKRYMIEAVRHFAVTADILPWRKKGLHVKARIRADITQNCIVTLEPIENVIEERFDVFMHPDRLPARAVADTDEAASLQDLDAPELLVDGKFDIGELAAQYLSLALDPYPRKANIDFATIGTGTEEAQNPAQDKPDDKSNPFAVLARLKAK